MGATQTDKGSASGKWGLIAAAILGAALIGASIWSLARALNNSAPPGSVAATNAAAPAPAAAEEEMDHEPEKTGPGTAPVIQAPVAPAAVIPTNQNNDALALQQARAKFNQALVKRLKQYVKDNPNRDNRELEKQIKIRENRGAQIQ